MSPILPGPWPDLPLAAWRPTRDTLHMWLQIVGKSLLACCPVQNHWWHTALHVTPRGLVSLPAAGGSRSFQVELDLLDHRLSVRTSDGRAASLPLASRPVKAFHEEYLRALAGLGLDVHIWPRPVEVPDPIPFDEDEVHREYDPSWAHAFWEVLRRCDATFRELAASFVGKQSPVHLFWGSLDLAATRFSGRRAPERPGVDPVTREAYSHEVISFGFWPGGTAPNGVRVEEPVLYAYAAPEPEGFRQAPVQPAGARYDDRLGEFLLPYALVRTARDPGAVVRDFCESVYAAGATLGRWDRSSLERGSPAPRPPSSAPGIAPAGEPHASAP